ncbi:hypothetical protein BUALT_Bualt02G0058100 [Buddleja alternifolia]|uniref:Uncharacterized protein n=1 Tax=Buddleja alternifolia TaxID=168488 RepID=A0AAV6XZY2_9LAMI|nr:hypothetical protein BUALT_Bualt02G0058100 [Buddleja alternifolia]
MDHPFRNQSKQFYNNRIEIDRPPPRLSGEQMRQQVEKLPNITFGTQSGKEKIDRFNRTHNSVKKSIFWQLLYWHTNLIRHNLDVMHIEKNVFNNIFNIVMDVKDKMKDNANARADQELYYSRPNLHLAYDSNGKPWKPKALYTLTKEQKREVCGREQPFAVRGRNSNGLSVENDDEMHEESPTDIDATLGSLASPTRLVYNKIRVAEREILIEGGLEANFIKIIQHLKKENKYKRKVLKFELYDRTHRTKQGKGDFICDKAKRVQDAYDNLVEDNSSSTFNLDAWIEFCGGVPKGRVYGFGSQPPHQILDASLVL